MEIVNADFVMVLFRIFEIGDQLHICDEKVNIMACIGQKFIKPKLQKIQPYKQLIIIFCTNKFYVWDEIFLK